MIEAVKASKNKQKLAEKLECEGSNTIENLENTVDIQEILELDEVNPLYLRKVISFEAIYVVRSNQALDKTLNPELI